MWTAWEPITAEIGDSDHLAPVIWRDRLYLFWVTFVSKSSKPPPPPTVNPQSSTLISVPPLKIETEAQLHWSEYVNGQWNTSASGELNLPESEKMTAISDPQDEFDPKKVLIHISKETDVDGQELGVFVHLGWPFGTFYLAGRNAAPEKVTMFGRPPAYPYSANGINATRYSGSGQ